MIISIIKAIGRCRMRKEDFERRKKLFYKRVDQFVVSGSRVTRERIIARQIQSQFYNEGREK